MIRTGRRPAPRTAPRLIAVAAPAALLAALGLGGCASSADESGSATPSSAGTTPTSSVEPSGGTTASPTAEDDGLTIPVTFDGDDVTPNGTRVQVPVGSEVTLVVTADQAGEIHVHSTPEQELDYGVGTTRLTIEDLDQPGVVAVESHALDKVIVQLQVQ